MVSAHVLPCSVVVQCRTHHRQIQQFQTDTITWHAASDLQSANNLYATLVAPSGSPYILAVVLLVEALRYKPEGRGFDSRWGR